MVPVPEVVWHDIECGPESGDLELWRRLAAEGEGEVLELGCGTGRVGLRLARNGHELIGIERRPALAGTFNERAGREGLPAQAIVADARNLHLRRLFGLLIAPMQLVQQVGDAEARRELLAAVAEHLEPGGRAGFAIVEDDAMLESMAADEDDDVLPEIREIHGWVFSSRPVSIHSAPGVTVVRRYRQRVSPRGEIFEEHHSDELRSLSAAGLEAEAGEAGLAPLARERLEPTPDYAPSTVVIVEKRL
jgi:SAM-dependent methyltransferase